ncbi:MAG: leucine--tRNA ligase [Candidatus Pacearchaeota archaeon]|nr:MAG: leucine--tRNA ligase [Candidatus Pacearchaeota archaeon]
MKKYQFKAIEEKWQKKWEKSKIFEVKEYKGKKFYCLEMYPYPSSSGLHMGHAFNYTIGDIYARFKRMNGFNVLYPVGYDSFGLPAENAAIKTKTHPEKFTNSAIKNFITQQKKLGFSYDWSRLLWSHDPNYYKWNQWIFLKMFEKGLAYRKKSAVNFCSKCETVLANEQVHNGKCWRHQDTDVEIKYLEQWFLKITEYAEELLKEIEKLNWPEKIKTMQRNWIGKSDGYEIIFEINGEKWPVFTTRPDTIFGVTFMVISAQHPKLFDIVSEKNKKDVEKFLKKIKSVSQKTQIEKEGAFTGSYALHPFTKEKIPIWVGNFVLADYGSGIVMGVPAHDERDFEFAKKYNLPIKQVVKPIDKEIKNLNEAYTSSGILINSKEFSGLYTEEAKEHIFIALNEKGLARKKTLYKLKDWLISRQRYWGTPIPIIYCNKCGIVPVPEKDLPVLLPKKVIFGKGNPLSTNKKFVNTKCPKCNGKARRETDTMDTFFDSSWYYLRFCDNKNKNEIFDKKKVEYWMPVDFYVGGAEHATMHLIYSRFILKFLRDLGLVKFNEPFTRLFNQGMIHGEDGYVMSKSRGNVVDPLDIVKKYGSDSLRFFLVSMASPDKDTSWNSLGIESSHKFLSNVFYFFLNIKLGKTKEKTESKINKTIKEVTENIENLNYNIAIIKLRSLFEEITNQEISKEDAETFLKLLHPFCPHLTEELWERLGNKNFISLEKWPKYDENKINKKFEEEDKIIENLYEDLKNIINIFKKTNKKFSKVYLYTIPSELNLFKENSKLLGKKINSEIIVFSASDPKKYDPENKSKKARPGKPGIYVE